MSRESLRVAFAAQGLRPRSKLVLLLLAERTAEGIEIGADLSWSAACAVCDDANMPMASVVKAIDDLIDHGYLPENFSIGSPE